MDIIEEKKRTRDSRRRPYRHSRRSFRTTDETIEELAGLAETAGGKLSGLLCRTNQVLKAELIWARVSFRSLPRRSPICRQTAL